MWPFSAIANAVRQRQRAIFWFWDGRRERCIDPMIPFRALAQHDKFDPESTPALIDLGNLEAMGLTADAVRQAFRIEALGEAGTRGLTESECVQLLIQFLDWMSGIKKKRGTSPTSMEPTGEQSDSPTKTGSDSSSMSTASKSGADSLQ